MQSSGRSFTTQKPSRILWMHSEPCILSQFLLWAQVHYFLLSQLITGQFYSTISLVLLSQYLPIRIHGLYSTNLLAFGIFFFFGLSNIHYLCITYLTPPTIGLACSTIYNWSSVTEMCSKDKHMTKADSVRSWKRNILSSWIF